VGIESAQSRSLASMGVMVFQERGRFGTGSLLGCRRTARTLFLTYEYVWKGQYISGYYDATRKGTKHPWIGQWVDGPPSNPTRWRGPAIMVETRSGRGRILSGEWRPRSWRTWHPWVVAL
jgi:hypothetical protein